MSFLIDSEQEDRGRLDLPSFIDAEEANFFSLPRTGDHDRDLMTGEAAADQALAYARDRQNGEIITLSLYSIISAGRCDALEIGYIRRIAAAAYAGSLS